MAKETTGNAKKAAAKKKAATGGPAKTASRKKAVRPVKSLPATDAAEARPMAAPEIEPRFPIVGIGASAGGLEALEAFFKLMPSDAGLAFVLVVHLAPTHISILPELLQKRTKMRVCQIADGMQVERNCVYVIPPNKDLTILHGTLNLMDLSQPRGVNLPIDSFFRSLAQDQERNAVCIILSGTGTDGTLGVKAIKGKTGMVMVQDEESAKYEGMPRSAISTGLVDYVLPPGEMPGQLVKYTRHATRKAAPRIAPIGGPIPQALQKIFVILRARTEHDFSLYKKNTICRRIERRMNVHQIDGISDYVRYLQESDREANILFKELLIGVTNFFRDPEAFHLLQTKALPRLLAGKPDDYAVRVWVPGCASGEEAYSLAIVLHECMEQLGRHFHVQVFGTDIDEDAINVARAGIYPESIVADVSQERIRRFFTKEEDGQYRVRKLIREMLVFAPQNVIKDPPFTKLDVLSCRNVLIYLGPELQRRLLPVFHYSLKSDGILFLGSSETIGQATDLFALTHKKWKIYRRKGSGAAQHAVLDFPPQPDSYEARDLAVPQAVQRAEELSALQLVETILQQTETPPCAIINDACNVVYIHGRTGKFLEPAAGKASVNIVEMARPGLRRELASAIRQVATHKQETTCRGLTVDCDGDSVFANLTVKPILEQIAMRGLMMVVFEETAAPAKQTKRTPRPATVRQEGKSTEELERDLQYTRENLQTTIEELETSNEELKSINEELQSTNEELQSTNEELETSKEELQSLNEESATVNAELQARIDELSNTNDDMKNLLDSTEIATIFLDTDLRVRGFTPKATDIIPLTAADSGRPINHLASMLLDTDLVKYGGEVLSNLAVQETEAESRDGRHYVMRVRPYRTVRNVIDGVVITFEDVTERQRAEDALRNSERIQRLALQAGQIGAFEVHLDGSHAQWTPEVAAMWGFPDGFDGDLIAFCWEHVHPDDLDRIKDEFERLVLSRKVGEMDFRLIRDDGEVRWIRWRGQAMHASAEMPQRVVGVNLDITEGKRLQIETERSEELLKAAVKASPMGLVVAHIDTEARYTWVYNPHTDFGNAPMVGKRDDEIADNQGSRELRGLKEQVLASGVGATANISFPLSDGVRMYKVAVEPILDDRGRVTGATSSSVVTGDEP
jgi:two-component system, chemotaxis family, CheB/CheR fusion protein